MQAITCGMWASFGSNVDHGARASCTFPGYSRPTIPLKQNLSNRIGHTDGGSLWFSDRREKNSIDLAISFHFIRLYTTTVIGRTHAKSRNDDEDLAER